MTDRLDAEMIRARVRVSEVVGRYVKLSKSSVAGEFEGLCPFHNEKSPSFTVNDAKGFYHCFGCQAHGTVIDAAMKLAGYDFKGALAELAKLAGVAPPSPKAPPKDDKAAGLRAAAERLWREAEPIGPGTPQHLYLIGRGLGEARGLACLRAAFEQDYKLKPKEAAPAGYETVRRGEDAYVPGLDVLVARIENAAGELVSVQRIYLGRDAKKFPTKDPKKALGKFAGHAVKLTPAAPTLLVGEGVETMAAVWLALRDAPDVGVWSFISSGGLKDAAIPLETRRLVIMADHDREKRRSDGSEFRPGQEAAEHLARRMAQERPDLEVSIAYPPKEGDDWNDVLQAGGPTAVRAGFEAARRWAATSQSKPAEAKSEQKNALKGHFNSEELPEAAPPPEEMPPVEDGGRGGPPRSLDYVAELWDGRRVYGMLPLGSDSADLWFWNWRRQEVYKIGRTRITKVESLDAACDPEWYWTLPDYFKQATAEGHVSIRYKLLGQYLRQKCDDLGPWDKESIRGLGATMEGESLVFHAGAFLIVDGERRSLDEHNARRVSGTLYAWRKGPSFKAMNGGSRVRAASDEQALLVADAFRHLKWRTKAMADLMLGWVALAPVCGALPWRPHVYLGGGAGAGKSWVLDNMVARAAPFAVSIQADSSAAGIAQYIERDARPVIFDEAEGGENEQSRARKKLIMELARAASSGYAEKLTLKGTASQQAKHYAMHAMFLLASVNLPEMTAMDESRWAMVQLREAARAPAAKEADKDHFDELLRKLDRWPEDIGDLLAGRALLHWRAILANYRTLRRIVAERLTPRLGDTYGMLLAGAHFLTDAGELTPAAAARLVDAIEWDEAEQLSSDSDAQRYLSFVASRVVKVASFQGPPLERTIRDLVQVVAAKSSQGVGVPIEEAERVLGALGIRVAEKIMTSRGSIYGRGGERSDLRLWLAREGGNLPSLLRGTQWSGNHLGPLRTLEDVATSANKMGFRGLRPSYGVGIPLREILGDDAPEGGAEQSTTNTTTGSGDEIPF